MRASPEGRRAGVPPVQAGAALYWLTLHLAHGNAVELAVVVAAQFLPMLLFSRRAGSIIAGIRRCG